MIALSRNIDIVYFSDDMSSVLWSEVISLQAQEALNRKESLSVLFHWKIIRDHVPFKIGPSPRKRFIFVVGSDGNWEKKNLFKFIDLNLFTTSKGPAGWEFKLKNKRTEMLVSILHSLWDPYSTQDTFVLVRQAEPVFLLLN